MPWISRPSHGTTKYHCLRHCKQKERYEDVAYSWILSALPRNSFSPTSSSDLPPIWEVRGEKICKWPELDLLKAQLSGDFTDYVGSEGNRAVYNCDRIETLQDGRIVGVIDHNIERFRLQNNEVVFEKHIPINLRDRAYVSSTPALIVKQGDFWSWPARFKYKLILVIDCELQSGKVVRCSTEIGGRGIRTPGGCYPTLAFQASTLNHSDIPPIKQRPASCKVIAGQVDAGSREIRM